MTRPLRYVYNADGELVSELDVELPAQDLRSTVPKDPRRARRWQARPVEDPDPTPPPREDRTP